MLVLLAAERMNYAWFAIAAVTVLFLFSLYRKRKWLKKYSEFADIRRLGNPKTFFAEIFQLFLSILIILGFGLAISEPKWKTTESYFEKEPLLISIWFDNSLSTLVRDVISSDIKSGSGDRILSRREIEIAEIRNLVSKIEIDHVGLGIFADKAYPILPLIPASSPYFKRIFFAQLEKVEKLDPNLMVQGTNIGEAILQGLYQFPWPSPFEKILILLTDGEQKGEEKPLIDNLASSLKLFLEKKEHLYIIGVGDPNRASLVPKSMSKKGKIADYLTLPNGSFARSKPDFYLLEEIAKVTGGKFIPSTSGQELQDALSQIFQERRIVQKRERVVHYDVFQHILGTTLFLLILVCPRRSLFN